MRLRQGGRLAAFPRGVLEPRLLIAYLDTNAVSNLSRWRERASHIKGIEEVSRDLCSFASRRTIALGQWLFAEMSFLEDDEPRRKDFIADLSFVNRVQFLRIFRSSGEMMRLEAEGFARGLRPVPWINAALPIALEDPVWRLERESMQESKAEFQSWEAEADVRINVAYPDLADRAGRLAKDWTTDRRCFVVRWIRQQMRKRRAFLGLPRDERTWPHPEQMPTLWCHWSYRIARDLLIAISQDDGARKTVAEIARKPKPLRRKDGDFADWCHFQTAAHADEFVTSDVDFLRFAQATPGPKPEFLSLEQWVQRLTLEGSSRPV